MIIIFVFLLAGALSVLAVVLFFVMCGIGVSARRKEHARAAQVWREQTIANGILRAEAALEYEREKKRIEEALAQQLARIKAELANELVEIDAEYGQKNADMARLLDRPMNPK